MSGKGSDEFWLDPDPEPSRDQSADYYEKLLWCAVVECAMRDIRMGNAHSSQALHWFHEPDGSFADCCDALGLNLSWVRSKIDQHGFCPSKPRRRYRTKGV